MFLNYKINRLKWFSGLGALLALWLLPIFSPLFSPLYSEEKTRDLDYFIQKAIENNHELKAKKARARQAKKIKEGENAIIEDPMFSVGLSNVPLTTFPAIDQSAMSSVGFMLSQKVALPGEAESRINMALNEEKAREHLVEDFKRSLVYRVKMTYYDLVFLYRKKALLEKNLESLNGIVSVARAMVSVNKMNSAQLLKLEASLSQMESQIESTSAMIFKSESLMEEMTLVKVPYVFSKINNDDILSEKTDGQNQVLPEKAEDVLLPENFNPRKHPRYLAALALTEKSKEAKKNEEARLFPSLTFSAEYMLKEPVAGMGGDDMISLRVTAPLPLFYPIRENKKIEAAKEGMEEADQNLLQTELSLKTAWEGEYELAKRLLGVYKRYHTDTLQRSYASYKAMLGSLPSSRATLLDVLDSYRAYLDVSIKEAESYRDLMKAVSLLEYLAGDMEQEKENHRVTENTEGKNQSSEMANQKAQENTKGKNQTTEIENAQRK